MTDQGKKDLRRIEQELIRTLQPALNVAHTQVPLEEYLDRQDRLYSAYENLLEILKECVETGTAFWGNDDEDYLNVRAEHAAAYHLHVVNGDTQSAKEALQDSLYWMGHEENCPAEQETIDETGHYKDGGDQNPERLSQYLQQCHCQSLYERDLPDEFTLFARDFFLSEEEE